MFVSTQMMLLSLYKDKHQNLGYNTLSVVPKTSFLTTLASIDLNKAICVSRQLTESIDWSAQLESKEAEILR